MKLPSAKLLAGVPISAEPNGWRIILRGYSRYIMERKAAHETRLSMQGRKELKSITQKGGKCHLQTKANDVRISNRADDFS